MEAMNYFEAMQAVVREADRMCKRDIDSVSHEMCAALDTVDRIPETDRERAGRLLGLAWEKADQNDANVIFTLRGVLDLVSPPENSYPSADRIIKYCETYLAPKPRTSDEKLGMMIGAAQILLAQFDQVACLSPKDGAVETLRKALEATR